MTPRADEVLDALDRVVDPCSSALGVPLGLRAMGLVAGVEIGDGRVAVRLRLTSACCAYGPMLSAAAADEIGRLPAVRAVDVTVDHTETWSPADLSDGAAAALDDRRRRTIELTAARPHDWSTWAAP